MHFFLSYNHRLYRKEHKKTKYTMERQIEKITMQHLSLSPWLLITMPIDFLVSVDLFLIVMACQSQRLKSHVMNQLGWKRTHKCHYPAKALWASPYGSQPCPIPHYRSPPLPAPFLLLSAEVWAKLANLFHD